MSREKNSGFVVPQLQEVLAADHEKRSGGIGRAQRRACVEAMIRIAGHGWLFQ
jgi:hypothetical protein